MATLQYENVWTDKPKYDKAECIYYEKLSKAALTPLAGEVAKARQRLLEVKSNFQEPNCPVSSLEESFKSIYDKKFNEFGNVLAALQDHIQQLSLRISYLENCVGKVSGHISTDNKQQQTSKKEEKDDDDVDLFGSDSDEENEAAAKIREERLAAYNAKKSKKPVLIAKSNIILDVKPWDDETDMKAMEAAVRKIECDGLLWGAAKLVPLAYGIKKLQISCVVEDDKVSVDWLQEQIEAVEEYVQSVDIAAFNKV